MEKLILVSCMAVAFGAAHAEDTLKKIKD